MLIKKLCYSSKMNDCCGNPFTVDYFITKTSDLIHDEHSPYGIIIEKTQDNTNMETYSVSQCFNTTCNAEILLGKLCDNSVTPVTAEECVDIILGDCSFIY